MIHSEVSEYESSIFRGLAEFFYDDRVGNKITLKFKYSIVEVYICSRNLCLYFTYCIGKT